MKTSLWCIFFGAFALHAQELSIHEISERTLRLHWSLRERPFSTAIILYPDSKVLASLPSAEKLRSREFKRQAEEVRVGQLRVAVTPQPLTVSVRRADGKLVQELTFENNTNGTFSFRTEAPVLGLGEGAQQFDRRGALYPMEPSWGS